MLKKLDDMYQEKERLVKEGANVEKKYAQINEDIELLEAMIMYVSNKQRRVNPN